MNFSALLISRFLRTCLVLDLARHGEMAEKFTLYITKKRCSLIAELKVTKHFSSQVEMGKEFPLN